MMDKKPQAQPLLSTKEKRLLLKPRIGFESIATRLAEIWSKHHAAVPVPDMTSKDITDPVLKSEALRVEEERAKKEYEDAFDRYSSIHEQRMQFLDHAWRKFLVFYDFLKPAVKHDTKVAQAYQFVIDFMGRQGSRGPKNQTKDTGNSNG